MYHFNKNYEYKMPLSARVPLITVQLTDTQRTIKLFW